MRIILEPDSNIGHFHPSLIAIRIHDGFSLIIIFQRFPVKVIAPHSHALIASGDRLSRFELFLQPQSDFNLK